MLKVLGFEWIFVDEDVTQRRAIMIASKKPQSFFEKMDKKTQSNKIKLLYRYSRLYAAHIRDILKGQIRI